MSALEHGELLLTDLSHLMSELGQAGINGPKFFDLAGNSNLIGSGAQFDVFQDRGRVYKRIKIPDPSSILPKATELRFHYRTIQLELASLCDPVRRTNSNIAQILGWGYDNFNGDTRSLIPFVEAEAAMSTLASFLHDDKIETAGQNPTDLHHHICLDIASGLQAVHASGLAHGDLKPSNVLIYPQKHSEVPFIAKLSDFGQCLILRDSTQTHQIYRGTSGWLPPEIADTGSHLTQPELPLFAKCDAYTYGLLVMSVFLTSGDNILHSINENHASLSNSCCSRIEDLDIADGLTLSLKSLAMSELSSIPENRRTICADLLQCNVRSYHDWSSSRQYFHELRHEAKNTKLLSADLQHRTKLDRQFLDVLEDQFQDPILSPNFDHSTLFTMALSVLDNKGANFRTRAALYFLEAARRSHIPAQAMAYRLLKAVPECDLAISEDEIMRWLFNGARTGSLIAMEDLRSISQYDAVKARKEFVKNGGYNQGMSSSYLESFRKLTESQTSSYAFDVRDDSLDKAGNRLIHYAATFGDTKLLSLALQHGAQINITNDRGETALYKACLAGNAHAISILAEFRVDAKIVTPDYGISCLHWLFNFDEDKQSKIAHLLVDMGAKVSACSEGIERAAEGQHTLPLPWLHFPFHWPLGTPLHWATFARRPSTCDILLNLGSDVNQLDVSQDQKLNTPFTSLSIAASTGDSRMLGHLLSRSAKPEAQDWQEYDAIHLLAANFSSFGLRVSSGIALKYWILHCSWEAHLLELTKCVNLLVDRGVDLNSTATGSSSVHCLTPIGEAATLAFTNGAALIALLRGGAQPKCSTSYEHRSLLLVWCSEEMGGDCTEMAYRQELVDTAESILEHTINFYHSTKDGDGLLHKLCAMETGKNFEYLVTRILSRAPELLETRNDAGETPLLVAARRCKTSDYYSDVTIKLDILLALKANILAESASGIGFLSSICSNRDLSDSACHRLAQAYVQVIDCHPRADSYELTIALQNASRTLKPRVVRLLTPLVKNLNNQDLYGWNAFDHAIWSAHDLRLGKLDEWIKRRIISRDPRNGLCCITRLETSSDVLKSTDNFLRNENGVERLFDDHSPLSYDNTKDRIHGVQRLTGKSDFVSCQ